MLSRKTNTPVPINEYDNRWLQHILQTQKKITKSNPHSKNFLDTINNFIRINVTAQTTTEIKYPAKVAIAAPSIPIRGINKKFSTILLAAPILKIIIDGHVFFTTRNWLSIT